ncbi:MAG TPA: N-acetylmuramoyl-L-alanine amidase [Chloroflexia bacterium]|nr:N-acetylmuramoyl-L-alanine amidase [Chloroflexia bacterium]
MYLLSVHRRIGAGFCLWLALVGLFAWGPAPTPARAAAMAPADSGAGPRVGLQVGHWQIAQLPESLARLRGDTGTAGGGRREVDLNMEIAQRTATLLRGAGVTVDLLPATVPTGYRADAFVAIHADGNSSSAAHGYKIAPPWRSGVAFRDQTLVELLDRAYGDVTGLAHDPAVTRNMRGYYAINTWLGDESRISDWTPAAIIETGYMTSPTDRAVLFAQTGRVAAGLARGILDFLAHGSVADATQAQAEAIAAASPTGRSVVVVEDGVPIRTARSPYAPIAGWANRGTILEYRDSTVRPRGPFINLHGTELASSIGYYQVGVRDIPIPLYISRSTVIVQQPAP